MRVFHRTHLSAAAVCVSVVWAVVGEASHPASASTSGSFALAGSAALPQWPCNSCVGTITAVASVSLTGTDQAGQTYTATWPDPSTSGSNLAATFTYSQFCPDPTLTVPPITGFAVGSFVLSNGELVQGAALTHGARLEGDISWSWGADGLAIAVSGTDVYDGNGTLVATSLGSNNQLLDGRLVGDLVPLDSNLLCTPTSYNIHAEVQAAGLVLI